MKFDNYVRAKSLQEAFELNKSRRNIILGGMGWCKMDRHHYHTAIDLADLGLDRIDETADEFIIGAMVSLRALETHASLNSYTSNAFRNCLGHIVGTQFRRSATIGGSVWGRFGFSDPITLLLCLDTSIELFNGGILSLSDFLSRKKDFDILTHIRIRKHPDLRIAYVSLRNASTDFPILTTAVSRYNQSCYASIGARPSVARLITGPDLNELIDLSQTLIYQGNLRGSAEYRQSMAKILLTRAFSAISEEEST